MSNQIIIDNFKKLIKLIELETYNSTDKKEITANKFRVASLKKSLKILLNISKKITDANTLKGIKGIGPGTINRIDEILRTGSLAELKNYDKIVKKLGKVENIVEDLTKVVGIGRVMAMNLITEYNITSATELKKLSDTGKINLNEKIKIGLKYLGKFQGNIPRKEIDQIYDYLQEKTEEYNKNMCITICGSYRRGNPTSSDIDILLSDLNLNTMDEVMGSNVLSNYVKYLHDIGFLLDDITDKNIKTKYMGFGRSQRLNLKSNAFSGRSPRLNFKNNSIRRVDIRLIPMISYFPALLYFTGSYELNQEMRIIAKKLGYKLNEYGLYKLVGAKGSTLKAKLSEDDNEMIDIFSEQDVFQKLGMKYLEPIKR